MPGLKAIVAGLEGYLTMPGSKDCWLPGWTAVWFLSGLKAD